MKLFVSGGCSRKYGRVNTCLDKGFDGGNWRLEVGWTYRHL